MAITIDLLRAIVGFSILASHVICFVLIFTSPTLPQERVDLCILIGPIFAFYATAVARKIASMMRDSWDSWRPHPTFSILAIAATLLFATTLPLLLLLFNLGEIRSVGQLKTTIGILEAALGLYTGGIVDVLFARTDRQRKR